LHEREDDARHQPKARRHHIGEPLRHLGRGLAFACAAGHQRAGQHAQPPGNHRTDHGGHDPGTQGQFRQPAPQHDPLCRADHDSFEDAQQDAGGQAGHERPRTGETFHRAAEDAEADQEHRAQPDRLAKRVRQHPAQPEDEIAFDFHRSTRPLRTRLARRQNLAECDEQPESTDGNGQPNSNQVEPRSLPPLQSDHASDEGSDRKHDLERDANQAQGNRDATAAIALKQWPQQGKKQPAPEKCGKAQPEGSPAKS